MVLCYQGGFLSNHALNLNLSRTRFCKIQMRLRLGLRARVGLRIEKIIFHMSNFVRKFTIRIKRLYDVRKK